MALHSLGCDAIDRNDPAGAEPLLQESLGRFRDLDDPWGIALARCKLGTTALSRGDLAQAGVCYEEALATFRDQQDWRYVAAVLDEFGLLSLERKDEAGARRAYSEALALSAGLGDKTGVAWGLIGLAGVAALEGHAERAARLLGAAAAQRRLLGSHHGPHERVIHNRTEAIALATLGAATFASAYERGAALPIADAISEALAEGGGVAHSQRTVRGSHCAAGLTSRELDVLRLLAEGQSDNEIATALFISRRTASSHVAAIFRKLGVNSRAAAAAYGVRQGLA